jgi:hypothetical protein
MSPTAKEHPMRRLLLAAALAAVSAAGPASARPAGPDCEEPYVRPHVHAGVNCYTENGQKCGVYLSTPVNEACPFGPINLE